MTLGRIYDIILTILNKEGRGNIIKPERFTYLLQKVNLDYFNQQYEKWAGSQTISDSLSPFLVVDESVTFAGASVAISSLSIYPTYEYIHAVAARLSSDDSYCDIVTPLEWNEWASDVLMKGVAANPLVLIDGTNIKIDPSLTGDLLFSYLRSPATPSFDYYIDAYKNIQYLANGDEHTLGTGEVYSDGSTSGSVTGTSVELEWGEQDQVNIITMLLEHYGIKLTAPEITQYAMSKEQQQNVI